MGIYFFDSSAIVKRYATERGTAWVISIADLMAGNEIYLAQITAVEVVSAVTRRARSNNISATSAATALAQFRYDYANQYESIEITDGLIKRAMGLAEAHALRGYDAVQLAAAIEINVENLALWLPALTLVSADGALNAAATAEGLAVDDPNAHP